MFGFQTSDLFNNNKENISVAVEKKKKKKNLFHGSEVQFRS